MPEPTPPSIDRAALERIIQRAAELQTGEREIGDSLTPDEVLAMGKDVGIPTRYLRQAMLEEQTRTEPRGSSGFLDRAFGPGQAQAQRVIRGAQSEIEQRLLSWLEENELLVVQRQQPGRITWEPLGGIQAAIRKSTAAFGGGKRPYMLARAELIGATVTPLEPGYCHVALEARLAKSRGALVGGLGALTTTAAAATAILLIMSPFWWVALAPLPIFVGGGIAISRQFRPMIARAQLGLERALDHLERGDVKPSHALPEATAGIVGAVLQEVRKALKA
jgi:hypothetical protein